MTSIFLFLKHFFLVTKRTRTLADDKKDKFYETLLGSIWSCLLLFYSSKAYHRTFSPAVSKLWGKTSKASPQEINILFSYSFRPLSDSGLMILPQTFRDVIVEAITYLFMLLFFIFFTLLFFPWELELQT